MNNPFNYIDAWDIVLLCFGMLLKLFYTLNSKVKELGKESFSLKKYFDARHLIRWFFHITASASFILFAPQFLILFGSQFLPEIGSNKWPAIASFCVGFFGYDLVKLLEKIGDRLGINKGVK